MRVRVSPWAPILDVLGVAVAKWLRPRVVIPLSWVRFPPVTPNTFIAAVAPMVEQRIENPCVTGSSPVCGTKYRSYSITANTLAWYASDRSSILRLSTKYASVTQWT